MEDTVVSGDQIERLDQLTGGEWVFPSLGTPLVCLGAFLVALHMHVCLKECFVPPPWTPEPYAQHSYLPHLRAQW